MKIKTGLGALGATLALSTAAPAFAQVVPGAQAPVQQQQPAASAQSTGLPPQIALRGTDIYGNPLMMSTEAAIEDLTKRYGGGTAGYQQAVTDVQLIALDNKDSCNILRENFDDQRQLDVELAQLVAELSAEPKKRGRWTLGRLIFGGIQIAAAIAMPQERTAKILYTLMVAAGQAQATGDRIEYDRIMGLYNRYMQHYSKQLRLYSDRGKLWDVKMARWCTTMSRYDATYSVVNVTAAIGSSPFTSQDLGRPAN